MRSSSASSSLSNLPVLTSTKDKNILLYNSPPMSQDSARAGVAGKLGRVDSAFVAPSVTTSVIAQSITQTDNSPTIEIYVESLEIPLPATATANTTTTTTTTTTSLTAKDLIETTTTTDKVDSSIPTVIEELTTIIIPSISENPSSVTTQAASTANELEQNDYTIASVISNVNSETEIPSNTTTVDSSTLREDCDSNSADCLGGQAIPEENVISVAQAKAVIPRPISSSTRELPSRKSVSLPPLKTTPFNSPATRTTSKLPAIAATSTTTNTESTSSHSHNKATLTPLSTITFNEKYIVPNNENVDLAHTIINSDDSTDHQINSSYNFQYHVSGYQSDSQRRHRGSESVHPFSIESSTPTDYFTSPYVLPPIPSFSDMGLKFEKSRTNSSDSVERKKQERAIHENNQEVGERSSTPRQYHYPSHSSSQFNSIDSSQNEFVLEYDPLIFDQLQSDDNERYILWSSSSLDVAPQQTPIIESVPATPISSNGFNKCNGGSISSTTGDLAKSSSSKDKGRDSLEIERAHVPQKVIEGVTSEVSKSSSSPSNTNTCALENIPISPTLPTSPGFSKPLERLSGTISMKRPSVQYTAANSKGNTSPVQTSTQNSISNPTEDRIIMAATVEKLVERLTIDIDYTFLTDFFLIYRLFISPIALLKLLLARFKWALIEDTPQRQVVRVRTFVTMRHWLLNYFEYDFMNSKMLRQIHVKSLRELADHPIVRTSVRDKRIIKELRQLYHLKRKSHCREMAQMALERPSTRQSDRPSRRSLQFRRTTNFEWIQSAEGSSSKRSSIDISEIKQARHQHTGSLNLTGNRRSMGDNEGYFGDESTDNESELSSADGQEVEGDNIYEEEAAQFVVPSNRQTYRDISDNETEDSELEDEDDSNDGFGSSGQLPSPAFSASSSKKTETEFISPGATGHGTDNQYSGNSQEYAEPQYSPDRHHSYHHRSQTTPRAIDTRVFPRPLFCGDDSSSQYALSPPESPRLLEPYMNPPPRSITSTEKKKTWSHYMAATAEQLSKVKRALLPKASPSCQDLRNNSVSSTSSQSFLMNNNNQAGNNISRGNNQEVTISGNTNIGSSNQWYADERQNSGNEKYKGMQQLASPNTNTGTNSAVSSLDESCLQSKKRGDQGVLNSEWSSDEEDFSLECYPQKEKNSDGYDQACENSQHSTPTRSKRPSSPLDETMASAIPNADTIYQDWGEPEEEEEEEDHDIQEDDDVVKPPTDQLVNARALRRTTQKRDKRASWMTFSSTNSSIFGAVLSQGHLPPSQVINDKSDVRNLDRFVERLYNDQSSSNNNSSSDTGLDRRSNGVRRKSTDAVHERVIRDMAMSRSPLSDGNETTSDFPEKITFNKGSKQERLENEISNRKSGTGLRRNHTLAQHPHRQTVPIMHHHYHHHHYLQHRQSESLLRDLPSQQRRHSVEVQSLAWRNSRQKERKNFQETTAPISPPSAKPLLEGAAYAAALQETQRKLKMMNNQDSQSVKSVVQAPRVLPHPPGRPIRPGRARPIASLSSNSALQMYQPLFDPTRSSSDPYLLHMPDWEVTSPTSTISTGSLSSPPARGAIPGAMGAYKTYSTVYPPNQGVPFAQHHHQHSHNHEDSYNQQRSPMNPRFQNILSPNRDSPRPRPASIVLRYSPELIAQQLCLIEREQLNQVLWHELVNAGWKKKPQEESVSEPEFSSTTESSLCAVAIALAAQNGEGDADLSTHASPPTSSRRPWPLSRSQTSKTHMQRFPDQSHTSDSPNVTQLVDRFNLMCRWVTSEILKTTDLDQRIKVVERFIRIAQTCYNHSNFSSLTQIMVGLQVFEVSRLHRTWARVQPPEKKIMQDLTEFTSMSRNWKHIRNAMRSISEEWGAALPSGQETPPATGVSSNNNGGKQQSLNLFSKMTGRDKDKEREKEKDKEKNQSSPITNGSGKGRIYHYHSSSLGKISSHSMSTTSGSVSGHHKSNSGQGFPSLVSSLTKDKSLAPFEKDGKAALGGCIPLLAVYLSDLLYNTELPSFVEPKSIETSSAAYSSLDHHLPSPPQSATDGLFKANGYNLGSQSAPPPMVNMHKHRTTATIIKRILTFRAMANRYPFVKELDVYNQLFSIEAPDQLEIERLSDLCEEKTSSLASPVFPK